MMTVFWKGKAVIKGQLSFGETAKPETTADQWTVVILHSLAISVEHLCARGAGAPSVEELRPRFCAQCGRLARDGERVRVQGHGLYSRQVCGLSEGWIVIWVRRYLCRDCGHTMSRLPDWLHPWRWYAATVIVEALYRHLILREAARAIGVRFGRQGDANEWRSLRRWRSQLLVSPTLWGWLGSRLGVQQPAASRYQGRLHLSRLLGEMRIAYESATTVLDKVAAAVRRSLSGLVHNRREAWPVTQFRPGIPSDSDSGGKPTALPTEEGPVRGPPRQ
jgi:hypothetical protein